MTIDRKHLFDGMKPLFGNHYAQTQVDGIDALLDACEALHVTDHRQVAYILATPMIETGGTFSPKRESLNYSATALKAKFSRRINAQQAAEYGRTAAHPANQQEIANIIYGGAWGKTNLGNTQPNDGWFYRGGGLSQVTGRRLYTIFGLATNPDSIMQIEIAAETAVRGMRDGIFTGKKLADYLNDHTTDFVNARRIVNGLDRATDIAMWAKKFLACIQDAPAV